MAKLVLCITIFLLLIACAPSNTTRLNDLALTIRADQSSGEVGKPIKISFTVTRRGDGQPSLGALEAESPESVMDIIVVGSARDPFTTWSANQTDETLIRHLDLKIGESKTIELIWTPPSNANNRDVLILGILKKNDRIQQDTWIQVQIGNPVY